MYLREAWLRTVIEFSSAFATLLPSYIELETSTCTVKTTTTHLCSVLFGVLVFSWKNSQWGALQTTGHLDTIGPEVEQMLSQDAKNKSDKVLVTHCCFYSSFSGVAKWKCSNSLRTYNKLYRFYRWKREDKFGSNQVSSFNQIDWFYEVAHSQDINFFVIFFTILE